MNTPICDFVRKYAESRTLRLHMPGHKGVRLLGMEELDITEICGADSLYEAEGIIRESEENASSLFGAHTFYSAEGSSLAIRAMLYLILQHARAIGKKPLIAAGRNAHRVFLGATALLNMDVDWLDTTLPHSYLSCKPDLGALEKRLADEATRPVAVYITSPDYLGNTANVRAIADLCHRYGVLLLVDNAHGAYLKFLPTSRHPIDLGADLCCDSAHKTLPALTGAAYLHIAKHAPAFFAAQAKSALSLFGSTSPSYLILQSLDAVNAYLANGYRERLSDFIRDVQAAKDKLAAHGYRFHGDEPLKLTVDAKAYGYMGTELADQLRNAGIECEFADPDFTVLMLTPEIGHNGLQRLTEALLEIPPKEPIRETPPALSPTERVLSVRDAVLAPCERILASESQGRVLAQASVACPPAVPIVIPGERITADAVKCFDYYGITACTVVKDI